MNNIDQSLNLLKDLEVRLKYRKQNQTATRINTEQYSPIKVPNSEPWAERLTTAYENVEEKMLQQNKNLKKQMNKLIRMNQYLKNQLVKEDHYQKKQSGKGNLEVQMLKIEIEYLKELNRQKQLKIELLTKQNRNNKKKSEEPSKKSTHDRHVCQSVKTMIQTHNNPPSGCLSSRKKASERTSSHRRSSTNRKNKCPLCYH